MVARSVVNRGGAGSIPAPGASFEFGVIGQGPVRQFLSLDIRVRFPMTSPRTGSRTSPTRSEGTVGVSVAEGAPNREPDLADTLGGHGQLEPARPRSAHDRHNRRGRAPRKPRAIRLRDWFRDPESNRDDCVQCAAGCRYLIPEGGGRGLAGRTEDEGPDLFGCVGRGQTAGAPVRADRARRACRRGPAPASVRLSFVYCRSSNGRTRAR